MHLYKVIFEGKTGLLEYIDQFTLSDNEWVIRVSYFIKKEMDYSMKGIALAFTYHTYVDVAV